MNKPREIKFRAWNGKNKEFVYEVLCCGEDINSVLNSKTSGLIFQQFTGLHDKNGKEIYFGDICKVDWNDERYKPHNIEVEWNSDRCSIDIEGGSPKNDCEKHYEVIGNIYENKELLEVENE